MHILAVWSRPEHAKGKGAIPTALAAEGPDLPFSLCPPPQLAMFKGLKEEQVESRCEYPEVEALRQSELHSGCL